jgi:hypothetical protein
VTAQENQEASAGGSVFTRSRRAAAVVAFSLGLGSLVYGTVLALPAAAATGTAAAAACSTPVLPTGTGASGGTSTSPTGATSASAGPSSTGGTADATGAASDAAAAVSAAVAASSAPTAPLCPPSRANPSSGASAAGSPTTGKPTATHTATPTPSKSTTKPSNPAKGGPTATPPKATGSQSVPVYVVAPTGAYFFYTDVPPGNAGYQLPHGTISRAQIMARAQLWVSEQVPYSEVEWYTDQDGTYRQDCSGFVSMAWGLNQNTDFWTGNLNLVSSTIPAADLLPGDILLSVKHTILFAGWADSDHTTFDYYEESHPGTVAHYVTDAPLGAFLDNGFAPFRYDGVTDSANLPANPLGVPYSTLIQQGSEVDPAGVNTNPPGLRPSQAPSSAADHLVAQAAADDIAESGGGTEGGALAVGGAFLIGAGLLMRRPALQAHKRRH